MRRILLQRRLLSMFQHTAPKPVHHRPQRAHERPVIGTVLVAEDNPVNQQVIAFQLQRLGYRFDLVCNGTEAVEAAQRVDYSIILMDCHMPQCDGFTAAAALRELGYRSLPIVALTDEAMGSDRERCLTAGMDDVLAKPVTPEALRAMLRRWLPTMWQAS